MDYPKTHSLRLLFWEPSKIERDAMKFYEEYSDVMDLVEEACITAGYLGKEYSERSERKALELIDEFRRRFGKHHPLSDIDLAIVLFESAGEDARTEFYRDVRQAIGTLHPFELHVLTKEEWNGWYRKFVKEYIEIS